ncbi:leucine-rich repeat and IQ domain-containing protein 1-like, partial [Notothenia coriiceps]|uniref:Leucine-rich repeat and IQ domain-containing protein 1-like n=1 Tax=Notothenia coriiceps TaxID=8208 RepID=A0A6I9NB95_9TELE
VTTVTLEDLPGCSVSSLSQCTRLQSLTLRRCGLKSLEGLNQLTQLCYIDVQENDISFVDCENMTSLRVLRLGHNKLTSIHGLTGAENVDVLDLSNNSITRIEPQNVCESLEGCHFLREVQLTGNPLEQERGWSNASSSLDAVKSSCRHFTEALQLAEDQRYAHEYGDTTVTAGATTPEGTLDMDSSNTGNHREMESTGHVSPVLPNRDNTRCSNWAFEDKYAAEIQHNTFNTVATHPHTGPTVREANSESVHPSTTSSNIEMAPVSNHENLNLQSSTAAVRIQQLCAYRRKSGNVSRPSTAEEGGGRGGGDGGGPESGPAFLNGSVVAQHYAASVIQAFWRGFSLRRRLASALAAVTRPDAAEDDTFEEVDVDEFDFDEAALEKQWTLSLPEDSPPRRYLMSDQPRSLKPPVHFPEPSEYILSPLPVWRPKQAWVPPEQAAEQRVSPESSNRSKSPASASVLSRLSERSEKIIEEWGFTHSHTALQMLKRARKMKSTKQQQSKRRDPFDRHSSVNKCSYQLGPVEARNRPTQHNRNEIKVVQAELELQQAEKVERVKQQRAQQWLQTQAARSDRGSESVHFLPEISSDILNGGRVQLVADLGSAERHASGSCANNSLAAQLCNENDYPHRNSLGHARKEVPSPPRVTSAPSKKERMSFRDNPVMKSGGWGGGKKRDRFYK